MTRLGSKQVEWTTQDVSYLIENAGRITLRQMCRELGKSRRAVETMAYRLRQQGEDVDLRCYIRKTSICPACGCMRATLKRHGICEVCRKRVQLSAIHTRISHLLRKLPMHERAIYAETETEIESSIDPMPAPAMLNGLSRYQRERAQDIRDIQMEQWQLRNLNRQVRAAQKRKERIEKKLK